MKKIITLFLMMTIILSCSACGNTKKQETDIEPQVSQMKAICELATMDCYYHNVAKVKEEDAKKILWLTWDKHFWIEYEGVVTVGIDASLLNIEVKEEMVTITMPAAKVLGCKVDETTFTEDSFIIAQDSVEITAEDQTEALAAAQSEMEKAAAEDSTLLANAQQRAQKLLEDYVNNIGDSVGKQYKIKWIYVDDSGNELGVTKTAEGGKYEG